MNLASVSPTWRKRSIDPLRLKGEAGANLVGGLVKLLGINGGAEAELDAVAEEDVVSESDDAAVVELDLE